MSRAAVDANRPAGDRTGDGRILGRKNTVHVKRKLAVRLVVNAHEMMPTAVIRNGRLHLVGILRRVVCADAEATGTSRWPVTVKRKAGDVAARAAGVEERTASRSRHLGPACQRDISRPVKRLAVDAEPRRHMVPDRRIAAGRQRTFGNRRLRLQTNRCGKCVHDNLTKRERHTHKLLFMVYVRIIAITRCNVKVYTLFSVLGGVIFPCNIHSPLRISKF